MGSIELSLLWLYDIPKLLTFIKTKDSKEAEEILNGMELRKLIVDVVSGEELKPRHNTSAAPYVLLNFQGASANTEEAKATDDNNPQWNINFTFDVSMDEEQTLNMSVIYNGPENQPITSGEVLINLNTVADQRKHALCYTLKHPTTGEASGKLRVNLLWLYDLKKLI